MFKTYSNFVKAKSPEPVSDSTKLSGTLLSGEQAQKLYLDEIRDARSSKSQINQKSNQNHEKLPCVFNRRKTTAVIQDVSLSNKDLFLSVQNNDVDYLKCVLNSCPDKINIVDDYGWSLLMIACQANSVDAAKELLKRGINTCIRDKAGNSAQSLVIKNKNYVLADLLLSYKQKDTDSRLEKPEKSKSKQSNKEFVCDICNKVYTDREEHLSSTIHNISASKGRKIPTNYVIPQSNRGYQIMLKVGWDKELGLGRDGSGKKYPIKTVQKKDRKGLGHEKHKKIETPIEDNVKLKLKRKVYNDQRSNKKFEINFRREFY